MRIYCHHFAGNILPACRRSQISRRTSTYLSDSVFNCRLSIWFRHIRFIDIRKAPPPQTAALERAFSFTRTFSACVWTASFIITEDRRVSRRGNCHIILPSVCLGYTLFDADELRVPVHDQRNTSGKVTRHRQNPITKNLEVTNSRNFHGAASLFLDSTTTTTTRRHVQNNPWK